MKRYITVLIFLFSFLCQAQVTNEGKPKSWRIRNIETVTPVAMPEFNLRAILEEDKANEGRKDIPWRFGHEFIVDYNLEDSGGWYTMPDGSRIWRMRFYSEGAKTMNFLFSDYYMPKGATLYLYNNDRTDLLGAYDEKQNNEENVLGTWLIKGEDIWLEYYEPAEVAGQGKLEIFKVVHGYRTSESYKKSSLDLNDSGNCNYDVDCVMSDIEELKEINKKSVALMLVGNSSFCSGALINNTSNDGTPYFLTADHCYSNPSQWAFRFNWISPNPVCATTANSISNNDFNQTASGAILRARRGASDFCLVEITADLPSSWDLVWAGWDRSNTVPPSTFGIHHPSGDIMKACRDLNPPSIADGGGLFMWQINDWDVGVTEGGSSGSPLFDNNGRIIGQLFAGTAACSGTNDNGGSDIYGRFAASWDQGPIISQRLKEWLDPDNTNATTLDYYPLAVTFDVDAGASLVSLSDSECNATIEPIIKITNFGSDQLFTAQVNYQLNGGASQSTTWSGFLNSGQSSNITLPEMESINDTNTLTVTIVQPNGTADENTENNTVVAVYEANSFVADEVNFTLVTDNFGSDTSWQLTNEAGAVLYTGDNYNNNQTINEVFQLAPDCYTFTIFDSFGDGICCSNGTGSYTLETDEGIVIGQGGNFDDIDSVTFSLSAPASAESIIKDNFKVYPNPSSGVFTVYVVDASQVSYILYNVLGQQVATGIFSGGESQLDVTSAADGMYILQVTDTEGKITNVKLIKE